MANESSGRAEALGMVAIAAARFPELRICQIIVNATGASDPFYITDDNLAVMLLEFVQKHAPRRGRVARCRITS